MNSDPRPARGYRWWLVALALLTISGVVCSISSIESEAGHRSAFYQSLVNKGDLNIIDQVSTPDRWLVTRNYNHPTHLGTGIVTLWYVFYEYARLLVPKSDQNLIFGLNGFQVAAVLRNAFFLLLSLLILWRLTPKRQTSLLAALVLATPIAWYALFEPLRIETTVLAISSVLLIATIGSLKHPPSPRQLWALGLGIGMACTTVSVYVVFALPFLIQIALRKSRVFVRVALFFSGFAIPLGLASVNRYIQCGVFGLYSYSKVVELASGDRNRILQMLVRPNAHLLSSPINLVLYLALIVLLARALKPGPRGRRTGDALWSLDLVPLVFLSGLLFEVQAIPTHIDDVSSRLMLYVFPILAYSCMRLVEPLWRRWAVPVLVLVITCLLVNWGNVAQYSVIGIVPRYFPSGKVLSAFGTKLAGGLLGHAAHVDELVRLAYFAPAIALLAWLLAYVDRAMAEKNQKALARAGAALAIALTVGYATVTSLNAMNNRANVARLTAAGFFKETVVSKGQDLDVYDEVLSTLENGILVLPPGEVEEAFKVRARYLERAMPEVGVDPVGFQKAWREGCIRPPIWTTEPGRCARTVLKASAPF